MFSIFLYTSNSKIKNDKWTTILGRRIELGSVSLSTSWMFWFLLIVLWWSTGCRYATLGFSSVFFFFVFPFYFEWVLDEVGGNHRVNHGSLVSPRLYEPVHEPRKCIRGSSKRVVGAGQPFPNSGKTRGAWFSSIALVRDMWGGTRLSKVIISCWTVILSDSEMCC